MNEFECKYFWEEKLLYGKKYNWSDIKVMLNGVPITGYNSVNFLAPTKLIVGHIKDENFNQFKYWSRILVYPTFRPEQLN